MVSLGRTLRSLKIAAFDTVLERRPPYPEPDDMSPWDLYLAPHFDDICFSLGALVARRQQGILLTLFSNSNYTAVPDGLPIPPAERTVAVSALRRAEDSAFAQAVGLRQIVGGIDEAPVRGRMPFDTARAAEDATLLERKIMDAILGAGPRRSANPRPWLYCPMGIGGHIDHMTLLRIVVRHYDALRTCYRIAFYEDLHYASAWRPRVAGLLRFHQLAARLKPKRSRHPIGSEQNKLALVALYRSQFLKSPTSIGSFTPAQPFDTPAHEAIWSAEEARPH